MYLLIYWVSTVNISLVIVSLWGHLIVACQYLKGTYKKGENKPFSRACCNRTKDNGFKLREGRFGLTVRNTFFFYDEGDETLAQVSRELLDAPSLETGMDRALSNLF